MKSYHKIGDVERVEYEDGSVVEVNVKTDSYSESLPDGRVIARNYSSFIPAGKNTFVACSRDGGSFNYPLPADWTDSAKIRVFKINTDGREEAVEFKLDGGNLMFHPEANAPYKIVYHL
jgi:hypothetical protein